MNQWLAALIAVTPALGLGGTYVLHGNTAHRLVALELCSSVVALMLVLMSMGFDQPSFIDLALALVLLGLPGTLVYAHFLERWL
jgi:multisubunit Na+/H+ antiporter MnhF subunit